MRKSFSKFQREEILGKQDYKCRSCKTRFATNVHPQYDHINGDHSDNRTENGQAVCSNCHDAKSRKENVKRSVEKKDINFVRCCPFCGKKIKGKDYADDSGERITTEYMQANDFFPCVGCDSRFKIIRQDHKAGKKKLSGKKLKEVVKYCAHCGAGEFEPKLASNINIECSECHKVWGVWIKEYKKKGFWS